MTKPAAFVPYIFIVALLAWALVPTNPYSYYTFMRWAVCASFAFLALRSFDDAPTWGWVWIVCAGIYNPIVPIHSTRAIWSAVNVATILAVIAGAVATRKKTTAP